MMQLTNKPEQLRVLHMEDDRTGQAIVKSILEDHFTDENFEEVRVKQAQEVYEYYGLLPFENPHILVLDWQLKEKDISYMIDSIARFDGLVIFFSAYDVDFMKEQIKKLIGFIPENFRIFSKMVHGSSMKILNEVKKYAKKIGSTPDTDTLIDFL